MNYWTYAIGKIKGIKDEEIKERIAESFFDSLDKYFLNSNMTQEEYDSIVQQFRAAEGL